MYLRILADAWRHKCIVFPFPSLPFLYFILCATRLLKQTKSHYYSTNYVLDLHQTTQYTVHGHTATQGMN